MSLLLIALLPLSLLFRTVASTCSTTSNVQFTFYGYPDGSSDTTSFGCSGTQQIADGTAGGDGSYAHPETFATALNNPNFVPCEIIYIPLLQKYFQYMDHCEACMSLYPNTIRIDLWIGSDVNGGQPQIDCEDQFGLKTGQTIVRDPPKGLKVNGGQLWDNDSGTCGDATEVFPNYSTSEADLCSGGAGDSSSSSSSSDTSPPPVKEAVPSPSSTPAAAAAALAPTSSTQPSITPSVGAGSSTADTLKEKVAVVDKAANVKADVKPPAPISTTLTTVVSSSSSSSPPPPSSSPPPPSPSSNDQNCGITPEWPTPWLGHCVGAPCHEFNDCSGELICQGWPEPKCTDPRSGK